MKGKRYLAIALLVLVCVALTACVNGQGAEQSAAPASGQVNEQKEEISEVVLANRDLLERGVREIEALDKNVTGVELQEEQLIVAVNNYKLEEILEYKPMENAVLRDVLKIPGMGQITIARSSIEFSYSGEGFGSPTTYYGFYYTELDQPAKRTYDDLTPEGKGWTYKEAETGTVYYTEKIADHWYYCEISY